MLMPWHQDIAAYTAAQIAAGTLPPVLAWEGPPDIGKAHLVQYLAQTAICSNPMNVGGHHQYCGVCTNCHWFIAKTHPNIRWIGAEEGTLGIDVLRDAIDFLQHRSTSACGAWLLISDAEKMTEAASHALLKTLEEPAGDAHIWLVTDQWHGLSATVQSRCVRIRLRGPSESELLAWLKADWLKTTQQLPLACWVGLAQGAPLRAQQWLQTAESAIAILCQNLAEFPRNIGLMTSLVKPIPEAEGVLLVLLSMWVQDYLQGNVSRLPAPLQQWWPSTRTHTSIQAAWVLWDKLQRTQKAIATERSVNQNVHMEAALLAWSDFIRQHETGSNKQTQPKPI
ncbi:MAG: hypothetical protein V4490_08470 [Pseudomonadota bacterium]